MKGLLHRLLPAGLALFCMQCFLSLSGGGSSEAEGFTLAGQVVDSARSPVPGARVALFASEADSRPDLAAAILDSVRTDGEGRFAFRRLRAGRYSLLATAQEATLAAIRSRIDISGSDTLDALTVGRAASLSGVLPGGFPFHRADHVALPGTPYRGAIAADGSFRIVGIAAGTYAFAVVLRSNFTFADPAVLAGLDTLALEAGRSHSLDSLRIPSLGGAEPYLVDDFSDCDRLNPRGGEWWSTNDRGTGGNSQVRAFDFADPGDGTAGCAARFTFTFGRAAPYPFVGIGTYFLAERDSLPSVVDLEDAGGISFRLKGRGAALEVLLQSSVAGLVSGQGFDIPAVPGEWTTYTLDFLADMKDTFDSTDVRSWRQRRKAITHIQFDALPIAGSDSGEVWIDDVRILPR